MTGTAFRHLSTGKTPPREVQSEHPNGNEVWIKVTLNIVSMLVAIVGSQERATIDFHLMEYSLEDASERAEKKYLPGNSCVAEKCFGVRGQTGQNWLETAERQQEVK